MLQQIPRRLFLGHLATAPLAVQAADFFSSTPPPDEVVEYTVQENQQLPSPAPEPPYWTYPGDLMGHLTGTHGIPAWQLRGRTRTALLTIHDMIHEGRTPILGRTQARTVVVAAPPGYIAAWRTGRFYAMLGAAWCGPCRRKRAELAAAGVDYLYIDIDLYPALHRRLSRRPSIPQLLEITPKRVRLLDAVPGVRQRPVSSAASAPARAASNAQCPGGVCPTGALFPNVLPGLRGLE